MKNDKEPRLWVLGTSLKDESFNIQTSDKILFFSQSSIKNLDSSSISIENFYSRKNFNNEIESFNNGLRALFLSCDQILKSNEISGSFYDNGFWFVHRLTDLFFIHSLCDQIENQFSNVKLIVPKDFEKLSIRDCSLEDLNFNNLGKGLEHSLQFLHYGLPKSEILYSNKNDEEWIPFLRKLQFLKRSPEILLRKIKDFISFLRVFFLKSSTKKKILIAQTGYDADFLLRRFSKKTFKTISFIEVLKDSLSKEDISLNTIEKLETEINNFLHKFLPRFSSPLKEFFNSYIKNVSIYTNSIEKQLKSTLLSNKVDALVFSSGATNLVDRKSCLQANALKIPVIFMRHQGIELNFFPASFLDDFCENDLTIHRTQFLLNNFEIESYPIQEGILYKRAGFIEFSKPLPSKKEKKGILFSGGPPEHFTFKNPRAVITNLERFNFASKLISLTDKLNLQLDIKVHPAEWKLSAIFFKNLIKKNSLKNKPKILIDGSIERIMKNYGLIIIDIISSRVLNFALYHDMQTILYVPKDYLLNETSFRDLEKRIHIVRSNNELEQVLQKYHDGMLAKKSYPTFDRKYLRDLSHEEFIEETFKSIVS
tara:strand:- start:7462 stop:9249 length:1788 start_codon:yes stop_codon:yes gene_type:complete